MKNLFDYATKELSQDAFLRWLFENYDDHDIGKIAYALLKKFCALKEDEKIVWLGTTAQWINIDISVWVDTDMGRKLALFIEDKTYSNEHNQLINYDKRIDTICDREVYKIFYKTGVVEDRDREGVDNANQSNKCKWRILGIDEILSLFKPYSQSKNLIVAQYVECLEKIAKAINNTTKPQSSDTKIDFLEWQAYFKNTVLPNLLNSDKLYCWVGKAGQYPYVNLGIKKAFDKDIPFLEIRSRDCCGENFAARILCYGMPTEDIPQQKILMKKIQASGDWDCKGIIKQKRGKENYYSKQIGIAKCSCKSSEEFIALVNRYAELYLQLMEDWI